MIDANIWYVSTFEKRGHVDEHNCKTKKDKSRYFKMLSLGLFNAGKGERYTSLVKEGLQEKYEYFKNIYVFFNNQLNN